MTTICNITIERVARVNITRFNNRADFLSIVEKKHGLRVVFHGVEATWPNWGQERPADKTEELLAARVPEYLKGLTIPKHITVVPLIKDSGWSSHSSSGGADGVVSLTFLLRVHNAKLIPREEDVLDLLGGKEALQNLLWEVTVQALTEFQEEKEAEARSVVANDLLEQSVQMVIRRAKEVCRWDQRQAALLAEFEAEKASQAQKLCAVMHEEGITLPVDGEVDPRVVQAITNALGEAAKGRGTLGFADYSRNILSAKDVC